MKKVFGVGLVALVVTIGLAVAFATATTTPSPPINATVVSSFQAQDAAAMTVATHVETGWLVNPRTQTNVVEIRPVIDRVALAPLTASQALVMTSRTTSTSTAPTWTGRNLVT